MFVNITYLNLEHIKCVTQIVQSVYLYLGKWGKWGKLAKPTKTNIGNVTWDEMVAG